MGSYVTENNKVSAKPPIEIQSEQLSVAAEALNSALREMNHLRQGLEAKPWYAPEISGTGTYIQKGIGTLDTIVLNSLVVSTTVMIVIDDIVHIPISLVAGSPPLTNLNIPFYSNVQITSNSNETAISLGGKIRRQ